MKKILAVGLMMSGFVFGQVKKDTLEEKEYKLEATPYKAEKKKNLYP
ncbi:hypothetical protein [Chryseobacterium sp. SL1]|nr:hypothetical protein [Chryseobacterium sp. SL1]MCY1660352.1 hypothetical protein [Chryseobacterium sp. SL1]